MKSFFANGLLTLAGAGFLLMAGEAKATTSTYTAVHSPSVPNWNDNFVLQAFNPAWGSLQSVYILATGDVSVTGSVYNSGAASESFTFGAGFVLTVTLPGTLGFLKPSPTASAQVYNLASGATAPYGPAVGSDSVNQTYTLPGDMASFIGTGTLILPGSALAEWSIIGGNGNITPALNKLAGATVEVQYTYQAVPEPGSFALLALGGAVMLLRKRR